MIRVSGVVLPDNKKVDIALSYIYGVGRTRASYIVKSASIDKDKRVKDLNNEEVGRIQSFIDGNFKVEGDLRKEVLDNIKRLKVIGTYRGLRHMRNLPVRGQRTRSNARTKRGKRMTVGALKKEMRAKLETTTSDKSAETK